MSERKQLRSSKKLESHFIQAWNENKHKPSSLFTQLISHHVTKRLEGDHLSIRIQGGSARAIIPTVNRGNFPHCTQTHCWSFHSICGCCRIIYWFSSTYFDLNKRSPYSLSCQVSILSELSLAFIPSSFEYERIVVKSKEKESIPLLRISPL